MPVKCQELLGPGDPEMKRQGNYMCIVVLSSLKKNDAYWKQTKLTITGLEYID